MLDPVAAGAEGQALADLALAILSAFARKGERRGVSPPVQPSTGGLTPRRSPFLAFIFS